MLVPQSRILERGLTLNTSAPWTNISSPLSLAVDAKPPLLNVPRLKELEKILTDYAVKAGQAGSDSSGDFQIYLEHLHKSIKELSSRTDQWVNPPAPA